MLINSKRFILFISIINFFLLLFTSPVFASLPSFDSDEGVYIFEENSGDVVYAQNEKKTYIPASTTKMMTAHLLMKYVQDLDQVVTVGPEISVYGYGDSRAHLYQGQKLTYRDLLYALLLPSGNDAAGTISVNVGRQLLNDPNADWKAAKQRFVDEMNNEARAMGLTRTHFENPQGTYNKDHFSTPEEFAQIVAAAVKDPTIREVTKTPSYVLYNENGTPNVITNTDLLIHDTLSGAVNSHNPPVNNTQKTDLISSAKTGTTDEGGRTFVFYSEQNGADIVGVLFKTEDQAIFTQTKQILDELYANYGFVTFSGENNIIDQLSVTNWNTFDNKTINLVSNEEVKRYSNDVDEKNYSTQLRFDEDIVNQTENGNELVSTVKDGQKVGAMLISEKGAIVKTVPIYAEKGIQLITLPYIIEEYKNEIGIVFLVSIVILSIFLFRERSRKKSEVKFV